MASLDTSSATPGMAELVRSFDWASTPLGPIDTWPESFRTMSGVVLASLFPMLIWWGPELRHFYNDGYRPMLGAKHPASIGQPANEVWAEIWDIVGPRAMQVLTGGPSTFDEDLHLPVDRYGFVEETYFTFSYSPIPEPSATNGVGGVLVTVRETTARVIGERRVRALRDLGARAAEARCADEACAIAIETLGAYSRDVPFALLYLLEGDVLRLVAWTHGASDATTAFSNTAPSGWMIDRVLASHASVTIDDVVARVGTIAAAPWPESVQNAIAVPIPSSTPHQAAGVLIAGLSPRLALNDAYRDFLEVVASQIGISITNARAYESERKRAEALAELDRAKTVFFSNISHEFRTPLTLLLGPTEEAVRAGTDGNPVLHGEDLQVVHRNALRLLRLVNTLLDFSRIEAGRMKAQFEPTDICTFTAELASSFRSTIERAGLQLIVTTNDDAEVAYLDHDMWEKIVFNLLSNAFKHTFRGTIELVIGVTAGRWILEVRDSGVGIPAEQLPHIFERFYRVPNVQSRSHEGTGIGLSLVHELVKLHGGTMQVESTLGEGTVFRVSIPTGKAHLPESHIVSRADASRRRTSTDSRAMVDSALSWLPSMSVGSASSVAGADESSAARGFFGAHILVADDNADMREYVARILRDEGWFVETAANGRIALEAARRKAPDVLLTDVMMPELGGFELLQAIRQDESTRSIPVVMLTARSGEEARVEGMRAGADDYLVKPFAARELVARLGAQIRRVRETAAERRRQEEQERLLGAIESERARLRDLFTQAPAAIAVLRGPEHIFEIANEHYLTFVGQRNVIGKPIREALPELQGQGIYELLDRVYATNTPYIGTEFRVTLDYRGQGPEDRFFNFIYQPIREADGSVSGTFVHAMDVTDLVHAKHDAEAARASAEEANRAKSAFLAAMSHELRTPLNAIAGYAQLLDLEVHGALNEVQHDALHRIQRSEQHLLSLINDVLNFAKLEAGHVEYTFESVSLSAVVTEVMVMMEPQLDAKGLAFEMRSRPEAIARADRDKVRQIVLNLLSNAVKFTERGGRVVLETSASGASSETVWLTVTDTGIGIPREKLEAIFDPFVQVHRNLTRVTEGTGLGLSISRDLARGMGGDLHVRSEEGHGSAFTLVLPRFQLVTAASLSGSGSA